MQLTKRNLIKTTVLEIVHERNRNIRLHRLIRLYSP